MDPKVGREEERKDRFGSLANQSYVLLTSSSLKMWTVSVLEEHSRNSEFEEKESE